MVCGRGQCGVYGRGQCVLCVGGVSVWSVYGRVCVCDESVWCVYGRVSVSVGDGT